MKRLQGLGVVVMFLALTFLVYRDVSGNGRFTIGLPSFGSGAQTAAETPAARQAVETWCAQAGCSAIVFIGGSPETDESYQTAVYIVTNNNGSAHGVRVVFLEAGKVVNIR